MERGANENRNNRLQPFLHLEMLKTLLEILECALVLLLHVFRVLIFV